MEFGRKGDAKRAMKLHHKEGITLKQAWKRVKGGKTTKSKKSKKSGMSPKKKKAVSNAKKAMRLHHREGITLKQAWKRVNKFGVRMTTEGECPDDYEMNPKWNGKNPNQRCIKKCGFLQTRDPATNRCKGPLGNMTAASKMAALKPGYEINPETGRPRKMCLPGQYRHPETGRCRNIKPDKGSARDRLLIDASLATGVPVEDLLIDSDYISPAGLRMDPMEFGGMHVPEMKYHKFGGMMYNPEMKHCNTFGGMHVPEMKYHKSMLGKKHYRTSFGTCAVCNAR